MLVLGATSLALAQARQPQSGGPVDPGGADFLFGGRQGFIGGGSGINPAQPSSARRGDPGEEIPSVRRKASYYSYRGGCYSRDRAGNWVQVDSRLC
jgi:hypothetical protein